MSLKMLGMKSLLAVCIVTLFGCATQIEQPAAPPKPAVAKLGAFEHVYIQDISVDQKYADQNANKKAVRKISEVLYTNMRMVFPNLKKVTVENDIDSTLDGNILLIKPHVRQIKFISGGARFWAGAMAGSSVVVMETDFVDVVNDKLVAEPEFQRVAGAYAGAWSIGAADNKMLEDIALDIVNYASFNR